MLLPFGPQPFGLLQVVECVSLNSRSSTVHLRYSKRQLIPHYDISHCFKKKPNIDLHFTRVLELPEVLLI